MNVVFIKKNTRTLLINRSISNFAQFVVKHCIIYVKNNLNIKTQYDNVYDFMYRFDLDDYLHLKK